jgi:hypothetical protein
MQSRRRWIGFILLGTFIFLAAAFVTLRAAEQAARVRPPPSAPEDTATITDDPATSPDPAQSADNNVSFPTDI